MSSAKIARSIRYKSLRVRSSCKVCDERLACRGDRPHATHWCKQCCSYQCESCEALLHQDFRLALHEREGIWGPPAEELCQGKSCRDKNFADLTCAQCDRNYCLVCDHLAHSSASTRCHVRTKFVSESEEFLSCNEISEDLLENLPEMMSFHSIPGDNLPDLCSKHESMPWQGKAARSFLLLNDKESLMVKDATQFIDALGCGDNKQLKVVSIFGNTGDGKSYTLNHSFFDGQEVFETSPAQQSCTVGVWAAYCPSLDIITVDTEGFLGQASNPNKRARMLLKVLAISDLVIYRTRAERLHNDMFSFLGDASGAYARHFTQELEEASARCNIEGPLSALGPSVVVFHETQHTDVLSRDNGVEPEFVLRARFQDLGFKVDAFSSLEYLGICSNSRETDFQNLRLKVEKHVKNSAVRVPRSPEVIFKVLKVLNEKFSGNIDKAIPNTFPDQYFTCSSFCKSCKSRCCNSMNHIKDDIPHDSPNNCAFQHQFDNRIFLCKVCYERGEKSEVSPKVMEANDTSWLGFAKYAWSGYILECVKCGVIYRSRQYWYGNQNPWETCVRTEICHVWPEVDGALETPQNTAQYVIDNLSTVSELVSNIGAKPTNVISSWVADQIAPSYWIPNSRITHCGHCAKSFDELEKKHHCRLCGGGFCENCTSKSRVVSTWGSSPVRVCDKCYVDENLTTVANRHLPQEVTVRKVGEVVHTTLGTVASAVSYPIGLIKDSARPSYWVADHLLVECRVCKQVFDRKLRRHHCRSCGEGVCDGCSASRQPVPSKGWDYPVRVCNSCLPVQG